MATLTLSPGASRDQAEVLLTLAAEAGKAVATAFEAEFQRLYVLLTEQPQIGAPRRRLGRDVRLCVVPPYNVLYRYIEAHNEVIVLRVLHGRRRITRSMMTPRGPES